MLLIKNANLITMEDLNYQIADVLISNGKIEAIGALDASRYPNVEIIDAAGRIRHPRHRRSALPHRHLRRSHWLRRRGRQ
ncbi:MAG: hypothetical protein MZU97_18455 [Bacillus subtilis]|nr:hypothetical protein [Bacillus subtilis]